MTAATAPAETFASLPARVRAALEAGWACYFDRSAPSALSTSHYAYELAKWLNNEEDDCAPYRGEIQTMSDFTLLSLLAEMARELYGATEIMALSLVQRLLTDTRC